MSPSSEPAERMAASTRVARPSSAAESTPRETMANSSPPRRATTSSERAADRSAPAAAIRAVSPPGCPYIVFASLTPSRSTRSTPSGLPGRAPPGPGGPPAGGRLEHVDQSAAVREAGERVGEREPLRLLPQLHEALLPGDDQEPEDQIGRTEDQEPRHQTVLHGVRLVEKRQRGDDDAREEVGDRLAATVEVRAVADDEEQVE